MAVVQNIPACSQEEGKSLWPMEPTWAFALGDRRNKRPSCSKYNLLHINKTASKNISVSFNSPQMVNRLADCDGRLADNLPLSKH
jgi:hypothetical protein